MTSHLSVAVCLLISAVTGQFNNGQLNRPFSGQMAGQIPGQPWGQNGRGIGRQSINPTGFSPFRTQFGNQRNPGWWDGGFGPMGGLGRQQYQTCIGRNNFGDEMRVTFTLVNNQRNNWAFRFNQPRDIKFSAVLLSSMNSNLQGEFRFGITEYGRVEDSCISGALGNILTANQWWDQNRIRGVVGSPLRINRGSRAASSEYLENLDWDEITGRGFVLCPSTQLSGSSCYDSIPLCCKIGRDSQDATVGFSVGQFSQLGVGGNVMGGMNMGGNLGGGMLGGNIGGGNMGGNLGGGLGGGLITGANTKINQPKTGIPAGNGILGRLVF